MSLVVGLGIGLAVPGQENIPPPPPALEFSGKPLAVPFTCAAEVLEPLGLACTEREPCEVFLEIAAFDVIGETIFLAGNVHTQALTFSSILLRSEDGGKTWREATPRIPQAILDGIQFVDFSNGWVGGQTLAQLPRDPFFLVTTDGGKTWNRRPVTEEGRVAAIDAFYFETRTDGTMILDRTRGADGNAKYELYETRTGGDTWMLREVLRQQPKLKKQKTPLTEFRLRADAGSRTYRLERLKSGRWNLVASFLIRLPDCRLAAEDLSPPPEPEPAPESPAPPPAKKTPPSLKKKPGE